MKEIWDQRFSGDEYVYGIMPNLFFKEKIEGLHPGRLLLPAEGEGRNAVFAARLGWQVTAYDYSEMARKKALKLAQISHVQINYLLSDISAAQFGENIYDAAGLIYAHLSPDIRKIVHQRIVSSLKPGGYLILEAFNTRQIRNQTGGPKSLEMLYTIPMLIDDFSEIEIMTIDENIINLDHGSLHQGEADIIRLFGRKY
jgi:SAM-dependent methyltransferase